MWKDKLKNYILDPKNIFIDADVKERVMTEHNLTNEQEFFEKRFQDDMTFLNFFFDTQIIAQMKLEMKVSTFDRISLIGGTLGLCTGISIITLIEIIWWLIQFGILVARQKFGKNERPRLMKDHLEMTSV